MDYQRILVESQFFNGAISSILTNVDMILSPVQPYAAPTHDQLASLASDPEANQHLIQFTAPFNISGHPCLSFPIGFTNEGMPIGGQLIGNKNREDLLCKAGVAIQKVSDWHTRHPYLRF